MPRVDYSGKRRQASSDSSDRVAGAEAAGVYALLLEQERVYGGEPDPRWARTEAARGGEPYPANWRGSALLLPDLESGAPVRVSWQRLSRLFAKTDTHHDSDLEEFLEIARRDRSIVGLRVHADDTVVPVRRGDEA